MKVDNSLNYDKLIDWLDTSVNLFGEIDSYHIHEGQTDHEDQMLVGVQISITFILAKYHTRSRIRKITNVELEKLKGRLRSYMKG